MSKETFENIITSNIKPKIENLKIIPIQVEDGLLYVVDIPQSNTVHQAKDFKYYKRHNFKSEPMENYEVKDVMNRGSSPRIVLSLRLHTSIYSNQQHILSPSIAKKREYHRSDSIEVYAKNTGKVLAKYINFLLDVPIEIIPEEERNYYSSIEIENVLYCRVTGNNTHRDLVGYSKMSGYNSPNYGTSWFNPILPTMQGDLLNVTIIGNVEMKNHKLFWTVYADNAAPVTGEVQLKDIPSTVEYDMTEEEKQEYFEQEQNEDNNDVPFKNQRTNYAK